MKIIETNIVDVKIIEPQVFSDERGFFMEIWSQRAFQQQVANCLFVQDNHCLSKRGSLRGLHYQTEQPQGKLVRVISGEVYDVVVDLRKKSPTFGHWVGVYLSAENKRQLWVPTGFAHGFYVTSDEAEFLYKCTDYYHPASEQTIAWDDPDLAISWPITKPPLLSVKDRQGITFADAYTF